MNLFSVVTLAAIVSLNCLFSEGNAAQVNTISNFEKIAITDKKGKEKISSIILYIKPTCPYCQKVLSVLQQLGKEVEIRDISRDEQSKSELIQIGGKKQVPCIVIDGKAKYESVDIIQWLIQNKDLY